ncbi:MAG: SDR family NAD(P)-dependent oxidoreductase [Spirochaetota bacterium]
MGATALVTGASSGIGRAFCEVLAEHGYDLLLVARRKDMLEEVAAEAARHGVGAEIYEADLSDEGRLESLSSALAARSIDVLVNNAGIGDFGRFVETEWEVDRRMIALNVGGFTRMLHLVAAGMSRRGDGRILNVASVAAFQPGPLMSVYYATKAYALSLSQALAEELSHTSITVTALCPGPVRSPFHAAAGMHPEAMDSDSLPTVHEVARYGYRAMMRGKRVAVYGLGFRLSIFVQRFLPRALVVRAVGALQKRRMPNR